MSFNTEPRPESASEKWGRAEVLLAQSNPDPRYLDALRSASEQLLGGNKGYAKISFPAGHFDSLPLARALDEVFGPNTINVVSVNDVEKQESYLVVGGVSEDDVRRMRAEGKLP